jgi:hypothetical protein
VDVLSKAASSESFSIMSSTSWCLFSASFFISAMFRKTLVLSIYERYVSMIFCYTELTTNLKELKALL